MLKRKLQRGKGLRQGWEGGGVCPPARGKALLCPGKHFPQPKYPVIQAVAVFLGNVGAIWVVLWVFSGTSLMPADFICSLDGTLLPSIRKVLNLFFRAASSLLSFYFSLLFFFRYKRSVLCDSGEVSNS